MCNTLDKIVDLVKKSWTGELNQEERQELESLLEEKEMQEIYQKLNTGKFIQQRLEEYRQFPAKPAFQRFYQSLNKPKRRKLGVFISVSAALVMLMLGIAVLWYWKAGLSEVQVVVKNESIGPGSYKATLRLADGRSVAITGDSMQIQENNGAEIKYTAGAIAYHAAKDMLALEFNELTVPVGGECYVILDDGTRVWVNAASKLKYPVKFIGKERKVFLEGEAYFDVVKDGKPFIVNTALGDIRVLGTSFNVKAYTEEKQVLTTLVTGKVSFQGVKTVELKPGEQVIAYEAGTVVKQMVDVEEYIAWKEGKFVFKDRRLEEIMIELARWYDVEVFYQQAELKNILFTGNLKRYDDVEVFMELLKTTNELKYSIRGNAIILYK